MHRRSLLLLGLLGASAPLLGAGQDPVESVMWDYFHQRILAGQPFVHDPRVVLEAPPFAEDSRQVPIQVDARAYAGQVVKIMAWAELNPIPQIFIFQPGERVAPLLAIRIRVEQATPIRAAVLTRDGLWHIGSTRVDAFPRLHLDVRHCAPRRCGFARAGSSRGPSSDEDVHRIAELRMLEQDPLGTVAHRRDGGEPDVAGEEPLLVAVVLHAQAAARVAEHEHVVHRIPLVPRIRIPRPLEVAHPAAPVIAAAA